MKKHKFIPLLLVLIMISFSAIIACTGENITNQENAQIDSEVTDVARAGDLRDLFLRNKDYATMKDDFQNLVKSDKIALWDEKLDQLLSENLPAGHKTLIQQLRVELRQATFDGAKLSTISRNLAQITPEEDFILMFFELNDYTYTGTFQGQTVVSAEIMEELAQPTFNYDSSEKKKKCNCKWTCDWYAGGPSSNCEPTTDGCGFMNAFECNSYVGPIAP